MNKLNCSKCPDTPKRIDCHICNMQKNNEIVDWINEHEVDCKLVDTNIDAETMKKLAAAVAPKLKDCPFCGERPLYIGEHKDRVQCLDDSGCAIYGVVIELPRVEQESRMRAARGWPRAPESTCNSWDLGFWDDVDALAAQRNFRVAHAMSVAALGREVDEHGRPGNPALEPENNGIDDNRGREYVASMDIEELRETHQSMSIDKMARLWHVSNEWLCSHLKSRRINTSEKRKGNQWTKKYGEKRG